MNYLFIAFDRVKESLGTGHIVRVIRIIEDLADHSFLRGSNSKFSLITNSNFQSEKFQSIFVHEPDEALKKIDELIDLQKVDVICFDCLDFCSDAFENCNKNGVITVGIDTSFKHSAGLDILINPGIKNKQSFLSGPLYSIHYEEIDPKHQIENIEEQKSLFICFGGLDFNNHLLKLSSYLNSISRYFEVNIVVSTESDLGLSKEFQHINFYYNPQNFYELLRNSSIAIISGGILFQEAIYFGVPSIIVPQYTHQYEIGMQKKLKKICLDVTTEKPNYKTIIDKANNFISKPELLKEISFNARASSDGFGLARASSILRVFEHLEWDSNFFNKTIYSLTAKSYSKNIKKYVDKIAMKKSIDLVYFLCPKKDQKSISFALRDNFLKVDDRVTYKIDANSFFDQEKTEKIDNNIIIRSSTAHEIDIQNLAENTAWTTRYTNDKNFNPEDIRKFYREWVYKSIHGNLDDAVYHIEEDNKICGFISIKKKGLNSGSIGLVAVADSYQGRGYGFSLVKFAVKSLIKEWNCASVEVVTQLENKQACRTYEKMGFHASSNSIWLHKWM